MSNLLSKSCEPDPATGQFQAISPESAGWKYVGFEAYQLKPGQSLEQDTGDREVCLVLLGGKADVATAKERFEQIGERMDPFERKKPYAVYVPKGDSFKVTAQTDLELGVCSAPGGEGKHPARLITPDDIGTEARGKGFNQRLVQNILPEDQPADSLLVVEVFTDEGNTSSYPSHKHDRDQAPEETYLEEVYYHRIDPPQGFVFQRVYTDDRSLDESMAVYNKDAVTVPKGYHPVATVAGYNGYYLNVMAGPVRRWCFSFEEDHKWVNGPDYPRAS